MSTKTISKRVALATVVALGAGVLSLVTVSSASATDNSAAGSASPAAATAVLNIGTTANTTGAADTSGDTAASSVGLVNVSDLAGGKVAGTTQTATLLSTGKLVVYSAATTSHKLGLVVTGGTIASVTNAGGINAGATVAFDNTASTMVASISPSSGSTSMTVALYDKGTTDVTTSNYSSGTLVGQIVVTIASSSVAGTASAAKSGVYFVSTYNANAVTTDDTAAPAATDTATLQFGQVRVRDAFGTPVTLTNKLLQVSATNGALVKFASASKGTVSSDYSVAASDGIDFTVAAPSSAPVSTVVTVTFDGTVIGTKTYTFTGEVAKITLSSAVIGKTSNTTGNTVVYSMFDSAGNALYNTYSNVASTFTPVGNLFATSSTLNSSVTAITNSRPAAIAADGTVTSGKEKFTCSAVAGKATISVTYTNNSGTVVTSNALPVTCSGDAVSYTAALDKSKYVPGDIATLTFTFKDSKGNLANDVTAVSSSSNLIAWTGSQLSTAVTGWTQATTSPYDTLSNGVLQLKFIVGSTSGTYTGIADAPLLDSTVTGQSAVTVSYSVSDGGTSLNDVLKGIVSLIASINKQIAALAKLVTKK